MGVRGGEEKGWWEMGREEGEGGREREIEKIGGTGKRTKNRNELCRKG